MSTHRAYLAELSDRAQRLEREHDQTSALAAAVERARIAARCATAWPITSPSWPGTPKATASRKK